MPLLVQEITIPAGQDGHLLTSLQSAGGSFLIGSFTCNFPAKVLRAYAAVGGFHIKNAAKKYEQVKEIIVDSFCSNISDNDAGGSTVTFQYNVGMDATRTKENCAVRFQVFAWAEVPVAASDANTVTVSWNRGRLKLQPEQPLAITEACAIGWRPDPDDPCNIVGIFGLPDSQFSAPRAFKAEEGSPLDWFVWDAYRSAGTFSYSILAVKEGPGKSPGRVAYRDPQITNEAGGSP